MAAGDWLALGLVVVALAAAGVLGLLWRRARQAAAEAELWLARAERARQDDQAAAAWHQAQLSALLEAQPDPVIVISPERQVLALSRAAQSLFGAQAAPGQTLIRATRSVELDELAGHCLGGGVDCDRQMPIGAGQVPFRVRAAWIAPGQPEHPSGAVLVLQDLGELQRLGRARRDFVANISHELRTPITSIRLLVDTLRGHQAMEPGARDELLEKIAVETETLGQLSQELLDLAQIESGQALARLVPTPVSEIVTRVTEQLGPQAERKQIDVTTDVPGHLVAWADLAQVTRALGNLVHNAIKFTPAGGHVRVSAAEADGDVVITVADNGPGISVDDLPRVFERFFRGDRSRAGGGTGLGLAIARHVVEAHGGRIWVESEGRPGRGATFHFSLAAAPPESPRPR